MAVPAALNEAEPNAMFAVLQTKQQNVTKNRAAKLSKSETTKKGARESKVEGCVPSVH